MVAQATVLRGGLWSQTLRTTMATDSRRPHIWGQEINIMSKDRRCKKDILPHFALHCVISGCYSAQSKELGLRGEGQNETTK